MSERRVRRLEPDRDATTVVGAQDLFDLALTHRADFLTTGLYGRVTPRSRRRTQRRLRVLLDHELLRAHLQGDALHREQVYTVTTKGLERLHEEGLLTEMPARSVRLPRAKQLAHALLTRAVFIEGVVMERAGVFERVAARFDGDLAADPLYQTARLVPDALLSLTRAGTTVHVGVEADRGTETIATLHEKFRRWKGLLAAAEAAPATLPAVLLVVVVGVGRRRSVERIAREVLRATQVVVTLLDDLDALMRAGWPHVPAAANSRNVAPQVAVFRAASETPTMTFRPIVTGVRGDR